MSRLLGVAAPLVALAALIALPADTEAAWRRARARNACCPCPPVVYYCPPQAVVPTEYLVSKKTGRVYELIDDDTEESYEKDVRPIPATAKGIDPFNSFIGKSRRVAKVSIVDAPVEDFASVSELFSGSRKLKSDSEMRQLKIPSGKGSEDSDRVAAERRTLRVRAFLYHFSSQKDNDYHLIIGDPPGTPGLRYMNVEISGLPTDEDEPTEATKKTLAAARAAFKDKFNLGNTKKSKKFKTPMEVIVTGSAFWDAEHWPDVVGPKLFKPLSAWEIHPITSIEFEP